jgi:trehalose/maltose hydrolase-like predicted phosphorylase
VTLDVARAFSFFSNVTGDPAFLREKAWPVLAGVAQWLTSRVTPTLRGFEINASMGIAERAEPVSNAAFMNMAAIVVLRAALDAGRRLGEEVDASWEAMAKEIVIPRCGNAIISHDGFRADEEKGATPDPLMGIFPFGFAVDPQSERATLDLYLEKAKDYIGSPMLSALYGAWAACTGDRKLALELLDEGYGRFCVERFCQTLEYRADRFPEQPMAGPFFANIGAYMTGLLFGFTGVRPSSGDIASWPARPVVLPEGWTAIEIDRVWIRGRPMRIVARDGATRAELIG